MAQDYPAPDADVARRTALPAPGGLAPDLASHSSRIVPVQRRDIFLIITLIFVLANVYPNIWLNVATLGLLLAFFVLVLIRRVAPRSAPRWSAKPADHVIERLRENPWDLLTVIGIVGLTIAKDRVHMPGILREYCNLFLVMAAIFLSRSTRGVHRRAAARDSRSLLMRILRRGQPLPTTTDRVRADDTRTTTNTGTISVPKESSRQVWEQRQKERWEEWMRDEVERLNEDNDRPPDKDDER